MAARDTVVGDSGRARLPLIAPMSAAPAIRRAAAEIEGQAALYRIGSRSIHQFWHLFAAHFRHVFLAPQRRPDSGRVAWTWREDTESRPVTSTELTEVRRRLSESLRSLTRGFDDLDRGDATAESIDGQVRAAVSEMVGQLVAQRDAGLAAFVCRTDAGLMLHSWGASTAAKPFFPDAQNGEISGNVVIGTERLSGVNVVLENEQGSVLGRIRSESEGVFRFPNVAPGNYRVRTPDRSEFPVEGITVTMERESVTGLELRGASAGPPEKSAPAVAAPEGSTPWYKRKWLAAVGLLLVLCIGGCIWNSSRTSSEQTRRKTDDSGWQSANGQISGTEGKNGRDDRKVGTEGAFSSLSSSLPPPKIASTPHGPHDSGDRKTGERAAAGPSGSEGDRADAKGKNPEVATDGNSANPTGSRPTPVATSRSLPRESSTGKQADAANAGESQNGEESQPLAGKAADASPPASGKKQPQPPKANASSAGNSSPTQTPNPDSAPEVASSAQDSDTSVDGTGSKSGEKKGSTPSSKNAGSPTSGSDAAATDAQQPSSQADNRGSNGATPSVPGGKPTAATAASPTTGTHPSAGEQKPRGDASAAASDEAIPSDAAEENNSSKGNPSNKSSSPKTDAKSQPDESKTANQEAKNDEPVTASATKNSKSAGSSSKKNPEPAKSADNAVAASTAVAADDSPTSTADTASADPEAKTGPAAKSSGKKSGQTPTAQSPPEQKPEEVSEALAKKSPVFSVATSLNQDEGELVQTSKVRSSPWKARLVQDLIIPTHPLTAHEEEQMDAMRKKLRQERLAQMPQIFQIPRVKSGVILEFNRSDLSGKDSLQWHDEYGRAIPTASVRAGVAEVEWEGATASPGTVYVLSSREGKTLVRMEVDQSGLMVLKMPPGAQIRYWVGIEIKPTTETTSRGFDWRLSTGEAIPTSWPRDNEWLGGKGRRIEIPLDATSKRVGHYGISLVDSGSHWALSSEVLLQ